MRSSLTSVTYPQGGYPGRGSAREGVESGYSTQSREKERGGRGDKGEGGGGGGGGSDVLMPYPDSDSQVWHPQETNPLISQLSNRHGLSL